MPDHRTHSDRRLSHGSTHPSSQPHSSRLPPLPAPTSRRSDRYPHDPTDARKTTYRYESGPDGWNGHEISGPIAGFTRPTTRRPSTDGTNQRSTQQTQEAPVTRPPRAPAKQSSNSESCHHPQQPSRPPAAGWSTRMTTREYPTNGPGQIPIQQSHPAEYTRKSKHRAPTKGPGQSYAQQNHQAYIVRPENMPRQAQSTNEPGRSSAQQSRRVPDGQYTREPIQQASFSGSDQCSSQQSLPAPFDPSARPTFCNRNPTETTDAFSNNAHFHVKRPDKYQEYGTEVIKDSYHWPSNTLVHQAQSWHSKIPTGEESIWRIGWEPHGDKFVSVPTCHGYMNGDKCPPNLSIETLPQYPIIYRLCSKINDSLLTGAVLPQEQLDSLNDMVDKATRATELEYQLPGGHVQVQKVVDVCDLDGPEVWHKSAWLLMRPVRIVADDLISRNSTA